VVEKLGDVWAGRDFPVLVEVTRRIDGGEHAPTVGDVAEALGFDVTQVQAAGAALERRGLVSVAGAWGAPVLRFVGVSGAAYLATGLHPDGDDDVSRLIDALRQAAELQSDPEEKSRIRRVVDAIGGVSREVLAEVVAAVITRSAGL